MKESSSKTESRGRRLLIAVILFLAGPGVVLIAGVIFMQEEITSLRGKVAELKPLQDDVTTGDNKTRVSRSMAERGPARGEMNKGRHLGRTKQSQCQRIRIPLCQNMPYNLTQFPNLLNHRTQYKAIAVVEEFRAVVFSECSPLFRPFLCSVLAPPCDGYRKPAPPC